MLTSNETRELKALLRFEEGVRFFPYDCSTGRPVTTGTNGKVTIGVGRNLNANPLEEEVVELLLDFDVARETAEAFRVFPLLLMDPGPRRVALVSMVFQLGGASCRKFRNLRSALTDGDFESAAQEMLYARPGVRSKWWKETRQRCERMAEMVRTNTYPKAYSVWLKKLKK